MTDSARRYGGRAAGERVAERRARLLAAGLELMGTRGVVGVTVRGVAEESGLAARYFYESFASIEALQLAVFEQIAAEAAQRALGALATAPDDPAARTRAVLAQMAELFLEDPRKGRIALLESITSPVLGPRVLAESRRFAGMLAATASSGDPAQPDAALPVELRLRARFLIGGVAHALSAALQGDVEVERDRLVDVLVDLFLAVRP
ncbi:TetR/AcrR family transcriptional regulator [Nocardioides nitrophenolicus]|uniref:TetR/AcrR family transcriptional regulator n=1 Tax=Nocardioides nitrophenolicus TaxID=60489 RepID=UPI0027DDEB15|nr:TetR/AcrR family transcriptional regulator [Nocardioides nitrophenolicus]MBM7517756.1 AcrR family transcriptional regulator [Nocardioides nitrophenolicus]